MQGQCSSRVYATVPKTSDVQDGFLEVTFAEVQRAVDSLSHQIERHCGKNSNFETLLYLGPNDLRYAVFWFAAFKCGFQVSCEARALDSRLRLVR